MVVNTCAVTAEAERQARQAIAARIANIPGRRSWSPAAPPRSTRHVGPRCPASPACSAIEEKLLPEAGRRRARGRSDIMSAREPPATPSPSFRPRPGLRAGPAGLRPPLHLLHHPVRAGTQPLACRWVPSSSRCARWSQPASGSGADRRGHHQLRPGLPAPTLGQMVRRLLARCRNCPGCGFRRSIRRHWMTISGA